MSEWFENDAFWDEMGPYMFNESRQEQAIEQVDGVVELLGLKQGARVLDLCCGPGRHSLELERRGFRVTAVDRHERYLERLRAEGTGIEVVSSDMREFVREGAFDGAINLFSSFGYFREHEQNMRVLRNVAASLVPGGGFLLDVKGKEALARQFRPRDWHEHEDGSRLLERRTLLDGWKRVHADWTLLRGDERHEFSFATWLYSAVELEGMLREAGFSSVRAYGAFDGSDYDQDAKRLVVAATK